MNDYVKSIIVKKQTDEIIEFLENYIKSIKELSVDVNRESFINEIFCGSYLENEIKKNIELYVA